MLCSCCNLHAHSKSSKCSIPPGLLFKQNKT
jgi:hypothetical protein